jgi:hypothetical protein
MTEPIKLPPLPGCLAFYPLSDKVALDEYIRFAIEQATAEMRAENERLREAAKQALDTLESLQGGCTDANDGTVEAITVWCPEVVEALRAALKETK